MVLFFGTPLIIIIIDDAKKISRLNAPGFNGLVVAWNA